MKSFPQFPNCSDADAISVACLDIYYYVTVHSSFQKKSQTLHVTLSEQQEQQELSENVNNEGILQR